MNQLQSAIFLKLSDFESTLQAWKNQGEKIVFTNGCFDILHRGHVQYLFEASLLGSKLVIGLNSDNSVKSLNKGKNRPINKELDRAFVLSALSFVSAVVIFDEATPLSIIEKINPTVLVKGADYSPENVVGKEIVEKNGGKLVLIPFLTGYSTTTILEKLNS